jgi:transposase-like protein
MICPCCGSRDIRNYLDKENNLSWYLCADCRYEGYVKQFYDDADADYRRKASSPDGIKINKK